jgi:hypothetical protein
MKIILRILKWLALSIVFLLILLFCASLFLQNKVVNIFLSSINKNIATKIEVGTGSFSLINKFPKASVRLDNVVVLSSPDFDRTQFRKSNTDTLLRAKSVTLEFQMMDLLKGIYSIESISVSEGTLNLYSDKWGKVNYEFYDDKAPSSGKEIVINLDKIKVTNLLTSYTNIATSLNIDGLIKTGLFKSRIAGNNIDFSATSAVQVSRLDIFPLYLNTSTSAAIDINLHKSDSGIVFRKGILKLDNFNLGISGMISSENKLDLSITGRNIDVSKIKKFISEKSRVKLVEYQPSGILRIDCGIHGFIDRINNPLITINFSLLNGQILNKKSNIKLSKLSFSGNFSNGRLKRQESSKLSIKEFKATLGSSGYSGSFDLENFKNPRIDLNLSGDIILSEFINFMNLKEVRHSEGSAGFKLKLSGNLPIKEKYTLSDIINLNPEAEVQFKSMGFQISKNKVIVKNLNGKTNINNDLWSDGLSFSLNGQRFNIDGTFTGFSDWLAGRPVQIKAKGNLSIENFLPSAFLQDSSSVTSNPRAFKLPDGIDLDFNLNIDNLSYKKFSANKIKGRLIYKSGLLSFKSFNISSLDGSISGDCFLARGEGNSFISRGNFDLDKIDINKAYYSFNNFGQDFIKAENISGTLSGKVSLLLPLDSLLNPIARAATAEGKYTITDGKLINFSPLKSLSRFIELSELETVSFSKVENEFFIRNNSVTVPQMDIQSSAADFTISGKHSFENDYEYHVKMRLSVLLSKKVKKGKKYSTEFGSVEDDGLGRTSVFLKVTGKGEDVKVGYDLKAANTKVKQNFKSEKETLKSILNKEYGWYKKDSTVKQQTAPKPKFRIQFDETDTTQIKTDPAGTNKDRGNKSIFKKGKENELIF